ncbi:MAG: hypothetical protein CVT90_00805 [Candidatus Altiarchaeales archaeon HGW-Altiarchaeales-3]|nr:MAG: hypothetical protein CVT90_00805 [Candidatus Altiarchaeales archaeon HGW-Altiarchaeales-3]
MSIIHDPENGRGLDMVKVSIKDTGIGIKNYSHIRNTTQIILYNRLKRILKFFKLDRFCNIMLATMIKTTEYVLVYC